MTAPARYVALPGSNRPPVKGAALVGRASPQESIRVSIYARPSPSASLRPERVMR